jgi:hypothetical protein
MRKILYASAAIALLGAGAAHAGDRQAIGATAGATTGAIAGAAVGGPVGAAVGGVAGMAIGAATSIPEDARTYVVEHPVDSVAVEGTLSTDYALPDSVVIHEIPGQPRYGYVYVQDRPVIVRRKTREVVYASPGERHSAHQTGAIRVHPPKRVITYVERHQVAPVEVEGDVAAGYVIPESVELTPVPDNPRYDYVYVQNRPVLVDPHTRRVIWVR